MEEGSIAGFYAISMIKTGHDKILIPFHCVTVEEFETNRMPTNSNQLDSET